MMQVKECREYAEHCRAMAKAARNETHKAQYLQLADQWDEIAKTRRKLLKLKRKVNMPLQD